MLSQLWDDDAVSQREKAREHTRQAILAAARTELARAGGVGLSMRAIARDVGVVSSAVYRHFPTREALLTAMILESYQGLAQVLAAVDEDTPAGRWRALAQAFREWAVQRPQEFQLVYGTPIPDYQAPPETVPAAAAVAAPFLATVTGPVPQFAAATPTPELVQDGEPSAAAAVVAELAALVGTLTLELSGHLVGVVDPAALYDGLVTRQLDTLGLSAPA